MSERGVVASGGETLRELLATLLAAGDEPATSHDVVACVEAGRAFVDGRRLRPGDARFESGAPQTEGLPVEALRAGQRVELSALAHNTSAAPLVIEERWGLLAVFKPSGLASEPDRRGTDSLVSRLAEQLGRDVHAVSRLDAQVSGVMLVASDETARKFASGLSAAAVERYYTGLVAGSAWVEAPVPAGEGLSGSWRGAIGDAERGKRQVGGRGARAAVTHYRDLAQAVASTLAPLLSAPLRLPTWRQGRERRELYCRRFGFQIETGRTHQIRVHAAHAGFPLLGDTLYGGPGSAVLPDGNVLEFDRIALHASELIVRHAGDTWRVASPMPEVLEAWSARLLGQ